MTQLPRRRKAWQQADGTPDRRKRGRAGQRDRARRLARTGGLCHMCMALGRTVKATVVNHIIPLAHDGPDTDENTENLCAAHDAEVTVRQFGRAEPRADRGVDLAGRPLSADHPWSSGRRGQGGGSNP